MSAPEFTSVFAEELRRYLAFKQSMGCFGTSRIWYLRSFDAYCTKHGVTLFDRQAVEGWVIFKKSSQPGSPPSWMSYIRDFGRWMRTHNNPDAYVLTESWKSRFVRSQPYLLRREEIKLFFQSAAEYMPKVRALSPKTIEPTEFPWSALWTTSSASGTSTARTSASTTSSDGSSSNNTPGNTLALHATC